MVILHIASIDNNPYNGVVLAVQQMVQGQKLYSDDDVGFVNVRGIRCGLLQGEGRRYSMNLQLDFDPKTGIQGLMKPFDRPDLVVFHEIYYPPFLKLSKECRRRRIPYIIVPHGGLTDAAQHIKHLKKLAGNMLLFNRFIMGAEALQCLSEAEAAKSHFDIRKFIGTNGINLPKLSKLTEAEPDEDIPGKSEEQADDIIPEQTEKQADEEDNSEKDDKGLKFIYIGRINMHIKGLDILVSAVAEEADFFKANGCSFDLYGPDYYNSVHNLQRMIKELELEELVRIHEPVMGKEKEELLLASDIFIQTSRSEGMPTGILEAMSYGIPCVLSEGTGLTDIVTEYDAGWCATITQPDTRCVGQKTEQPDTRRLVQQLAQAMTQAVLDCAYYDKEKYYLKCRNTRKLIGENFSLQAVSEKTLDIYRRLLTDINHPSGR